MYEYTQNNLIKNPITYQFSNVSSIDFLKEYTIQRENYIKIISQKINSLDFSLFLSSIHPLNHEDILKLQKKFEVKKVFFNCEKENISFLTLFAYYLILDLEKVFCFSLFSTLLKVHDSLTSIDISSFSKFELYILEISLKKEQEYFQRVYHE